MKRALLLLLVTACCGDRIIRNDFQTPAVDGSYRWALQTEAGIFHEQRGSFRDVAGHPTLVVEGQYQYTAPDGQIINVVYRADENGYQATGAHLPTAPSVAFDVRNSLR